MTTSQQGRRNRRHGNDAEVEIARYLTVQLGLNIVTARSISGGRQLGVDLVEKADREILFTVHGWSLEVKAEQKARVTPWLRQAKGQADGGLFAVVWKQPRKATSDALVFMPRSALVWWLRAESVDDPSPVCMSLSAFVELLVWEPWERADAA